MEGTSEANARASKAYARTSKVNAFTSTANSIRQKSPLHWPERRIPSSMAVNAIHQPGQFNWPAKFMGKPKKENGICHHGEFHSRRTISKYAPRANKPHFPGKCIHPKGLWGVPQRRMEGASEVNAIHQKGALHSPFWRAHRPLG